MFIYVCIFVYVFYVCKAHWNSLQVWNALYKSQLLLLLLPLVKNKEQKIQKVCKKKKKNFLFNFLILSLAFW